MSPAVDADIPVFGRFAWRLFRNRSVVEAAVGVGGLNGAFGRPRT